MDHWIIIIIIIIISGIIGGVVNYLLVDKSFIKFYREREFYKSLFIGLAASLLVPLFLNTISSDLLEKSEKNVYDLFIVSGFCIIASIYSKNFIQTLSDKLIKLNEKVENVKKEVNALADNETENESHLVRKIDNKDGTILAEDFPDDQINFNENDSENIKILKALAEGKYTFRSLQGISKETGLNESDVNILINKLSGDGLIDQSLRSQGIRFFITKSGREYLSWYNKTSYAHLFEKKY